MSWIAYQPIEFHRKLMIHQMIAIVISVGSSAARPRRKNRRKSSVNVTCGRVGRSWGELGWVDVTSTPSELLRSVKSSRGARAGDVSGNVHKEARRRAPLIHAESARINQAQRRPGSESAKTRIR